MTLEYEYVLRGIVGSTAHGLAHEDSDEDLHGVFAWPTERFWDLQQPAESIVGHEPSDYAYHELQKFLGLASRSNPQVLELLWLDKYVDLEDYWGERLIEIRDAFPSSNLVFHAYAGYADAQFRKLNERGETFSSSTRNRTFKHAKHMFRLLEQGKKLYTTGVLSVQVEDRDWYLNIMPDMTLDQIKQEFQIRFAEFKNSEFILPVKPDYDAINHYLYDYRKNH